MTIQNTTLRKAGPSHGNGVTTVFPFTFKVFTATDILVTYLDALDVESVLVLSTNYTVTLNADQNTSPGGSVALLFAPATGTYITLTSQVTNTQTLALTNSGGFYPESINNALDRTVIQVQQVAEELSRTFKIPISSIGTTGQNIGDYIAQAEASANASASSASDSATSAYQASNSATSSSISATNSLLASAASSASATAAANSALIAVAPAKSALATYIDAYFPASRMTTFTSIYVGGGWDMGNITQDVFTNETLIRWVSLSTDATASFNFGTVP
jgi:hypothetical protein